MAKVIQIFNQKGGAGKTTSTIQIAAELSKNFGKRCLLFDFDPSCNLTNGLAHSENPEMYFSDIILEVYDEEIEEDIHLAICKTEFEGIDLVPEARKNMKKTSKGLPRCDMYSPVGCLDPFIEQIYDEYDFIFFDCAAGGVEFNLMAMCAAEYLLIPTDDNPDGVDGASATLTDMRQCKKLYNPKLDLIGVYLSNSFERRTFTKELKVVLGEQLKDKLIPIAIRNAAVAIKARTLRIPLCYAFPNEPINQDYHKLAEYILEYTEGR